MHSTNLNNNQKIKNAIISLTRKENDYVLDVYCLQKDINVLKEKNRLFNLCQTWHIVGRKLGHKL